VILFNSHSFCWPHISPGSTFEPFRYYGIHSGATWLWSLPLILGDGTVDWMPVCLFLCILDAVEWYSIQSTLEVWLYSICPLFISIPFWFIPFYHLFSILIKMSSLSNPSLGIRYGDTFKSSIVVILSADHFCSTFWVHYRWFICFCGMYITMTSVLYSHLLLLLWHH